MAWGLEYADGRARVVGADGAVQLDLASPQRALWWFGRREGVTARLVWLGAARTAALDDRAEAA